MVDLVMQASGNLANVDILELSESTLPGVGIFHTIMGLGRQMVKELDLKLTTHCHGTVEEEKPQIQHYLIEVSGLVRVEVAPPPVYR